MNNKTTLIITISFFLLLSTQAQIPTGFSRGSITLNDGTILHGLLNDQVKKKTSIIFIADSSNDRHRYDAERLNSFTMDGITYKSINGDFFKIICAGKISFLQKASNSGGRQISNGAEVILLPGTEGEIGDYFSYCNNHLTHITAKTLYTFIATQLSSCAAANDEAKTVRANDISSLANAITIYNNSVKQP